MAKKPKATKTPTPQKRPKSLETPGVDEDLHPVWRFSLADQGGPFPWPFMAPESHNLVIGKLLAFESLNFAGLRDRGCHPIEIFRLEKEAQKRLEEIHKDDLDELFSFRLSGEKRVWCIQERNIFYVLWWDPKHQVYRTPPDKADRKKKRNRR